VPIGLKKGDSEHRNKLHIREGRRNRTRRGRIGEEGVCLQKWRVSDLATMAGKGSTKDIWKKKKTTKN